MGDPPADPRRLVSHNGRSPTTSATKKTMKQPQRRKSLLRGDSATTPATGHTSSRHGLFSAKKDKEVMAASFLQFCAMCEHQIMTPCNSILYCSEACRLKDSVKPLSACSLALATSPSPPRPATAPVVRIPTDEHAFKSDLDPTEWKPKLGKHEHGKTSSEAFRYLSRFHQNVIMTTTNTSDTPFSDDQNNDTSTITTTTVHYTPGLSLNNTPITSPTATASASSSFTSSTLASYPFPSSSSSAAALQDSSCPSSDVDYDYDYAFTLRPLPPRQNPLYYSSSSASGGGGGRKGIDLVTPHIVPASVSATGSVVGGAHSFPTVYDHDFWGKKTLIADAKVYHGPTPRSISDDKLDAGQVNDLGALFGRNLQG